MAIFSFPRLCAKPWPCVVQYCNLTLGRWRAGLDSGCGVIFQRFMKRAEEGGGGRPAAAAAEDAKFMASQRVLSAAEAAGGRANCRHTTTTTTRSDVGKGAS